MKCSLCSCIVLLTSASIFMTIVLNFLLGKSLISVSLRNFSEVLVCCFIWNMFLYLFFLTLTVDFCALDKTTTFLSPEGVVLFRRWTLLFNHDFPVGFSQIFVVVQVDLCSEWLPVFEGVPVFLIVPKEKISVSTKCRLIRSRPSRSIFFSFLLKNFLFWTQSKCRNLIAIKVCSETFSSLIRTN